jgi:DNA-binding response OmpR family regulator
VESLLRRVNWDLGNVTCGDLRLDGASLQVYRDSKPVTKITSEQFRLFSVLLEKSLSFVGEEELSKHVYAGKEPPEKGEGIRGLVQRLRVSLGPQLGRRIKGKAEKGWIYLPPLVKNQ